MANSIRPLVAAWAALMALSLVLALAGDVVHASRLGTAMIVAVALAVSLKAHLVLRVYLGLKAAPGALAGFTSAAVLAIVLVAASFLVFPTPQSNHVNKDEKMTLSKEQYGMPNHRVAAHIRGAIE
jgi:hypothetical protein